MFLAFDAISKEDRNARKSNTLLCGLLSYPVSVLTLCFLVDVKNRETLDLFHRDRSFSLRQVQDTHDTRAFQLQLYKKTHEVKKLSAL